MDELEKSAYRAAEQAFNLNSPKQLAEILFDKLGLPMIKKTPSGSAFPLVKKFLKNCRLIIPCQKLFWIIVACRN